MTRPTTAVVVCAYTMERWDDLSAAMHSAAKQQPAPDELWLTVDHNPELLARAEAELTPQLLGLKVIANTRHQGLSGARNTALEQTSAEVVVFLDDDAVAEPDWLVALTTPYENPRVIAVGGVAKPSWPERHSAGRPVTLPSAGPDDAWSVRGELDWVVGCSYAGQPTELTDVRNLMGCNMSFRRAAFAAVGGFAEHLGRVGNVPLGCEETELCIRVATEFPGSRILLEPLARVRHHVSPDRMGWSYLRRRCYAEGVSKAAVAAMVGREDALSTERGYATQVLPAGVRRQLRLVAGPDERVRALGGAAAIVAGFALTALGYLRGRLGVRRVAAVAPTLQIAETGPSGQTTAGAASAVR